MAMKSWKETLTDRQKGYYIGIKEGRNYVIVSSIPFDKHPNSQSRYEWLGGWCEGWTKGLLQYKAKMKGKRK